MIGALNKSSARETIDHATTYIPFFIAILILELEIGYTFRDTVFYFTVCAAIGAVSAIVIQLFFPNILISILGGDEDIESLIRWGRITWVGYVITFPIIATFSLLHQFNKQDKRVLIPSLIIILIGTILTFSRTFLVATVIILLYMIVTNMRSFKYSNIFLTIIILYTISLLMTFFTNFIPNFENLISYRLVDFLTGRSDISNDLTLRYELYTQYIDNILQHSLLGQGLGVPYNFRPYPSSYADITFISFIIPFGIFGYFYFLVFMYKIFRTIQKKINFLAAKRIFIFILFVSFFVSFNDDIWSHKNFPVYFIFIINSFAYKSKNWRLITSTNNPDSKMLEIK